MRAFLLAAGFGTRLRPLTNHMPKCLVPIAGKPLLQFWLEQLHQMGVTQVLVNTHYLSEQVKSFVDALRLPVSITLSHEPDLLGTGGTLLANPWFYQTHEPVLIAHADNLCLCNWSDFLLAHQVRPQSCFLTMMLFHTDTPRACGIVEVDKLNRVHAFHEKVARPPSNLANAAVYLAEPEFFKWLEGCFSAIQKPDFSTDILPLLLSGQMHSWLNTGYHRDIGTPSSYQQACDYFQDQMHKKQNSAQK